jgi:hypothetical protein
MTEHPITPPPELIGRWEEDWHHSKVKHIELEDYIATQAAQWGADHELEACCAELPGLDDYLRAARRPKLWSLKEQALALLEYKEYGSTRTGIEYRLTGEDADTIRKAIEALPND